MRVRPDGRFEIVEGRIHDATRSLTARIMTLQAEGSYRQARALIEDLGTLRPPVRDVLARLSAIPVDIEPRFTAAAALTARD